MRVSNTVNDALQNFYAKLAAASAEKAYKKLHDWSDAEAAEKWAGETRKWLTRAGARATKDYFTLPR